MAPSALSWVSAGSMGVSFAVFVYEGVVYNTVFLRRILPAYGKHSFIVPFLFLFDTVWILALISYVRAHFSDPGRVPTKWQDFVENVGDALPIAPARPEWQPGKATYCKKCDMTRPERAKHCKVCEMCILRMDHHCPWINNCVGFNNHKFFILLQVYGLSASLIAIATASPEIVRCMATVMQIDGETFRWEPDLLEPPDVLAFMIFGLIALLIAVLMTLLMTTHLPLATENLTSIEDNYENMPNPFDQGSASGNLAQIFGTFGFDWCLPIHPRRPLTDGVSFARSDERVSVFGTQRSFTSGDKEAQTEEQQTLVSDLSEAEVEELWRIRFHVRQPQLVSGASDPGTLGMLARWWNGP